MRLSYSPPSAPTDPPECPLPIESLPNLGADVGQAERLVHCLLTALVITGGCLDVCVCVGGGGG